MAFQCGPKGEPWARIPCVHIAVPTGDCCPNLGNFLNYSVLQFSHQSWTKINLCSQSVGGKHIQCRFLILCGKDNRDWQKCPHSGEWVTSLLGREELHWGGGDLWLGFLTMWEQWLKRKEQNSRKREQQVQSMEHKIEQYVWGKARIQCGWKIVSRVGG